MSTTWTNNQHSIRAINSVSSKKNLQTEKIAKLFKLQIDPLYPVRQWLDTMEVRDREFAQFIYKAIPSQCPFERDIVFMGRKVGHIPPLCKLNPLYDQLVGLRFRALCYLVDECGVDLQSYPS